MAGGLVAIGRSSCVTGGELIRDLVRRWRAHSVVLVADNDQGKRRDNGASYVPVIISDIRPNETAKTQWYFCADEARGSFETD